MAQLAVAVVTGSNKGIGLAIVRSLCKHFHGDVYLTARDESRGKEAIAKLESEDLHPRFHQLDINDKTSIERLHSFLLEKYGGLDVLVNNAAIAYKRDSLAPFGEQAEMTLKTNYWATLDVCRTLFPILRPHARVVNVSSRACKMALDRCSESLRAELRGCKSIDEVNHQMEQFVRAACAGNVSELGWPQTAYGVSKIGLTLATAKLQREIDSDTSRSDIIVNSCSPGYVSTDMTSMKGTKTVDEGADTPVYLALLPLNTDAPRGEFVADRAVEPIW